MSEATYFQLHHDEPAYRLRAAEGQRLFRLRHPEQVAGYQRAYREAHSDERAAEKWLSKYGLTPEQYAAMYAVQDGRCAICRQPETRAVRGKVSNLAVDHDHSCCPGRRACGKCVRGLLCNDCNYGIGRLGDSVDLLAAAMAYLAPQFLDTVAR